MNKYKERVEELVRNAMRRDAEDHAPLVDDIVLLIVSERANEREPCASLWPCGGPVADREEFNDGWIAAIRAYRKAIRSLA